MANAFITRVWLDPPDTLNTTVSVQQANDPLAFINYFVKLPYNTIFQALPKAQQKAAIVTEFLKQVPQVTPPTELDPTAFGGPIPL